MNRCVWVLCVLLVGCGTQQATQPTPTLSPTPVEADNATAEPLIVEVIAPGINYPPDPQSVVQSFLTSLQIDPSGRASLKYLVPDLQIKVATTPLAFVLDIQTMYEWFMVAPTVQQQKHEAQAEATLHFGTRNTERIFTLEEESGVWRINDISRH